MFGIILLGPPGVGKGTQAKTLAKRFNIPHLSTGDMLRAEMAAETELGKAITHIMDSGKFVSDKIAGELVKNNLKGNTGFILDGYPRTINQAQTLPLILDEVGLSITHVILLDAPEEVVIDRIKSRAVESNRADDDIDIAKSRYQTYLNLTTPVITFYKNILITIDADKSISDVTNDIINQLPIRRT